MKKVIKNQFAFFTMLIVVMLFSSINTKIHGQIVLKTLGSAINAFTQIGPNRTRVSYAPGINTVLFVHRGDWAGSSGNKAMYDISTDGGSNWTSNSGPVIDLSSSPPHVRYPQGYIMNPANNTNITNARIVAAAPKATGVNNGWGRITSGMVTLAATGKKESLVSDSAWIPNSFVERIPGEYWMVSDTNTDGKITLYKGVYSLSGDSVAWTVALKLAKSRTLFDRTLDGNVHYLNPMVAFSPNGQIGWIATNGEIAGGAVDSTLYPIFWNTTNGGQTWTGPQVVRLKNLSNVVASVNSTKPTATIDNDLVVDKNGNPHFAFVVAPKINAYSYNNPTTNKYPIFDITKVNNLWTAVRIDTVSSLNGASFGTLTHDNEIQLSRTKDGSKIFYSWTDTKNPVAGLNSSPNLYIKGYNVDSNFFGPKISPTTGSSINNLVFLPNTSEVVSDLTSSGYKLHTVIATPTSDENVTVGFSYLDNLYYKFTNIATANVPNYVPTTGLVAYFPFNGNANDASGNNNNGTVNGATLTTDKSGNLNSAYSFDGINDIITASSINFPSGNSSRSISMWFKVNNIPAPGTAIMLLNYGVLSSNNACGLAIGNNGVIFVSWLTQNDLLGLSTISINQWYNLTATFDGSNSKLYLNGVLINSAAQSKNTVLSSLSIGYNGVDQFTNGKLDDIGIWNRALTQPEITAIFNQAPNPVIPSNIPTAGLVAYYPFNGNANDASGNGNNGTVNGATLSSDRNGVINNSYVFNPANSSHIVVPFTNSLNSIQTGLTMAAWAFMDGGTSIGTPPRIMELRGAYGGGGNAGFVMLAWGNSNTNRTFETRWYNNSGNNNISIGPTSTVAALNWHYLVYTADGNTGIGKFYVDGVLVNTNSGQVSQGTINACNYNNNSLYIGAEPNLLGKWGGKLDDIGIWNRALTQSEITALFNAPTAVASDSLWVINKQTDTLAFPSQVKLSLKSNNITSKNISAYDIKLNYDASKLKFDSVNKTNTSSANGSVIVNSATTGQVIIGWASSSSISSATLPLLNLFFTPIDSGKTTVSIANAIFNTDTVKNRYSKSVINKFIFGDVDMNKIIQSYDASVVLKYSIGIDPLPTIDPLPWEPWRIKVASVDSAVAVDANDASLILKYSVGIITKFPKRGMSSAPGYVTVNLENNELVVRSFEDMGGLNITFLDHLSDLGAPTYVHNTNALSAFNKQANMYKIGVAFSEAPINGTVILRIPYTGLGNQTLNMELVENTAARNYQLNVVTGINDIKNSNIKIYPNPANNIINIEGLTKNENNTIQIFDVQGKLVITKNINEKGTIDLTELNKGVYVIKIGEVAQRIVKM